MGGEFATERANGGGTRGPRRAGGRSATRRGQAGNRMVAPPAWAFLIGNAASIPGREKARPVLAEFRAWLEAERPKVLPRSPMGGAIGYALSNWAALERYTEDGDLDPDNNEAERAIRAIAIGRKNWLFCGSDNGGRTAATLVSICASCKRHGIDPWAYMRDVLVRVSTEPASRVRELLPDRWKAEREVALARGADPPSRAPPG